jgi:hypothetical protein
MTCAALAKSRRAHRLPAFDARINGSSSIRDAIRWWGRSLGNDRAFGKAAPGATATPVRDNRLDDWRNHFLFESVALPIIYILAMAGIAVALGGFFWLVKRWRRNSVDFCQFLKRSDCQKTA